MADLAPMSYEAANQWLECVDLDWIEEDESLDALLRDVSATEGKPSSDEQAA
jgi:hypothetical protein